MLLFELPDEVLLLSVKTFPVADFVSAVLFAPFLTFVSVDLRETLFPALCARVLESTDLLVAETADASFVLSFTLLATVEPVVVLLPYL